MYCTEAAQPPRQMWSLQACPLLVPALEWEEDKIRDSIWEEWWRERATRKGKEKGELQSHLRGNVLYSSLFHSLIALRPSGIELIFLDFTRGTDHFPGRISNLVACPITATMRSMTFWWRIWGPYVTNLDLNLCEGPFRTCRWRQCCRISEQVAWDQGPLRAHSGSRRRG